MSVLVFDINDKKATVTPLHFSSYASGAESFAFVKFDDVIGDTCLEALRAAVEAHTAGVISSRLFIQRIEVAQFNDYDAAVRVLIGSDV